MQRQAKLFRIGFGGLLVILATLAFALSRTGTLEERRLSGMPEKELQSLAAQRPEDGRVQRHWAERLLRQADFPAAEQGFRRAAELDATDAAAWIGWGKASLALGKGQTALEILTRAAQQWPENAEAQFSVAAAYTALGDTANAASHWREGLRRAPDRAEAWITLAGLVEREGNVKEAEAAYRRALELKPRETAALVGRARCLVKLGTPEEARPLVEAVLTQDPSHLEGRMLLGEILIAKKTPEARGAGMKEMARAGAFHPEAPAPHRRIAELWMEDGQFPDAAQAFAQAADREPSNESHLERAAEAYRRLNLPGQVKTFLARAAEVKQQKLSVAALAKEAAARPQDPQPLLKRAALCERLGWNREAAHDYRLLTGLQPGNSALAQKLAALERLLKTQDEEGYVLFSNYPASAGNQPVPVAKEGAH